jgi:hypothetical protein
MTTNQLWQELQTHKTGEERVFGRPYVYISHETFRDFQQYFITQFALFSKVENYRYGGWWRHIHAVVYKDKVCVHIDHCNPNVSFWLNIPHGFFDVLPYLVWCAVKRKKPFGEV